MSSMLRVSRSLATQVEPQESTERRYDVSVYLGEKGYELYLPTEGQSTGPAKIVSLDQVRKIWEASSDKTMTSRRTSQNQWNAETRTRSQVYVWEPAIVADYSGTKILFTANAVFGIVTGVENRPRQVREKDLPFELPK